MKERKESAAAGRNENQLDGILALLIWNSTIGE